MKKQLLFTIAFLAAIFVASAQSNTLTFTGSEAVNQEFGLGSNQGIYALSIGSVFTQPGTSIQYNQEIVSGTDAPVSETFSINTDGSNMDATLTFKYRKFAASTVSGVISIAGQADFPFDLPDTTVEDGGDPDFADSHKFFDYTIVFPISPTATNVTFTLNEFVKNAASTLRFRIYSIQINGAVAVPPLDSEAVLDAGNEWYHNYSPDTFGVTLNEVQGGVFLEQASAVATPTTTGNSSPLVAKFTKGEDAHSQLKFQLPTVITTADQSSAIFKIRTYVPSTNVDGSSGRRLRLFLRDGVETVEQKSVTIDVTVFDKWQEYTFDFTGVALTEGVSYSTVNLLFDQPDAGFLATGNVYYLDAFQGPSAATLPVNEFELNSASIVAYPNPVTNSFQIDSSINIENVKLYNVTGRLLKTFNTQSNYDISDLATGMYIANIKTEFGSKSLRIVKK
ncbi:putative secreted protein (Por secretion system target) [Mariniflexile fucanivorans]|uniref:Putative secreted protein (Por secretion system target) n=1 Tax=Mariniflexile fucanivorans TaxID=264023 RepID=A0A4R1RNG2_9FLAO|nr:T9SS type A sorting domain-containing protein [Mariniflexile fucanivorans]TCL67450.1 putative secreted protein (Por secretion system target) [Mariniflexile fucanivorans]